MREPDGKKKKKKHHQEKKKKKKHVHTEDITTGGESPASDSDKESDEGKSRDGYSSPDTGNFNFKLPTDIRILVILVSLFY